MAGDLNTAAKYATAVSSIALRLLSYVFLRWIPGHPFPSILTALLAIYIPSFIYNLTHTTPYDVVADEIDIITKEASPEKDAIAVDPRLADGAPELELDVQETVVVEERDPAIVKTILTGLPSPTSLMWSAVTFGINVLLFAMMCDLVFRPALLYSSHDLSMARLGYVSDTSAKILVREPDTARFPIFASYRLAEHAVPGARGDSSWKSVGSLAQVDSSTDFTGTFTIKGLKPDTRYQYTASNHTGFFTTAPRTGDAGPFTFLHSSCLINNFPYNPFAHPLSNNGLRHLSNVLKTLSARFMLFLGDFIYIDVPHRHGSSTIEDHRREYRQMYSSPDWAGGGGDELPWIHVYDDHEIANDWSSNTTGVFGAAFDPYKHYHTSVNPPAVRKNESYFSFTQGPATFFMLDTRRYRSPNDGTEGENDPATGAPSKTMLGAQQLSDLLHWLARSEPAGVRWKIIVSSVPFTRNWYVNAQDTWRGYSGERQAVLEAMWDVGLKGGGVGVVVLSGDRHEFAATAFPPPPDGVEQIYGLGADAASAALFMPPRTYDEATRGASPRYRRKRWPLSATVHEFSASPLNMFYLPFRTYAQSSTSSDYVSDVCIKYIPDGNSKFGAITITTPPTSDQSVLHYRLFVDGKEAWSYTLTTPPDVAGGGRAKDAIWG